MVRCVMCMLLLSKIFPETLSFAFLLKATYRGQKSKFGNISVLKIAPIVGVAHIIVCTRYKLAM